MAKSTTVLSVNASLSLAQRIDLLSERWSVTRSEVIRRLLREGVDRHPVPTNTETPDDSGPTDPASPSTSDAGGDVVDFRPHPAAQVSVDPATGRPRLTRHEIIEESGEGGIRLPLGADLFGRDLAA